MRHWSSLHNPHTNCYVKFRRVGQQGEKNASQTPPRAKSGEASLAESRIQSARKGRAAVPCRSGFRRDYGEAASSKTPTRGVTVSGALPQKTATVRRSKMLIHRPVKFAVLPYFPLAEPRSDPILLLRRCRLVSLCFYSAITSASIHFLRVPAGPRLCICAPLLQPLQREPRADAVEQRAVLRAGPEADEQREVREQQRGRGERRRGERLPAERDGGGYDEPVDGGVKWGAGVS